VFSGHVGLDPYHGGVRRVSGSVSRRQLRRRDHDVDAFEAALAGQSENTLLSHDLFEGLFARVALCTDLEVIDDYPDHYLTWAARLTDGFAAIGSCFRGWPSVVTARRWKILDNLGAASCRSRSLSCWPPAGSAAGRPALWTGVAFFVLFFPSTCNGGSRCRTAFRVSGSATICARAGQPAVQPATFLTSAFLAISAL
jgi:hypothetical protein